MNDTISTNPGLREEARRMAEQVATMPKLPYDPKVIAREEFERVIDKGVVDVSFEEFWSKMAEMSSERKEEVICGLQEWEMRQMIIGSLHLLNAFCHRKKHEMEEEKGQLIQRSVTMQIADRLRLSKETISAIDLGTATVRKLTKTTKRTCMIHPEGCPEDVSEFGSGPLSMLQSILNSKK